ncbi:Ankyrin-1 [Geodia barretti]|uniref:Ankyrin-1 n=1 Tax=Geodia barretti TaxID=519541 RepID=A0AA35XJL5_GEOBA|nr:Ankyrin-1 [Geodia barretti]
MDEFLELCSQESRLTSQERRERVKSLLEKGQLNPLQRHGDAGWYPLHYAAKYGRGEVIQLLVSERQCDPRLQTRDGRSTALHVACEYRQAEAIEALCRLLPDGAPARRDKNGNTPLHVACRSGSMEIVSRLTRKYHSARCMNETNRAGSTPFGTAVREGHPSIARFFMSLEVGNPASKFSDFREVFPSFRHKQSLDHPVSIFVMGNRKTGKSTLIKSVQIEGVLNHAMGLFLPTSNVEYHSGGIVASDVSGSGYGGRIKFYELASCKQSTQENIFSTFAMNGKAIFVITVSFKLELKQIEATLLYWLSFIHHQFKPSKMPYVAVVGSFLFYYKLGSLRLENRYRLHLAYHRVLSTHQELCSHFHFIGKFSMDCRRSQSPGMDQFRKALHRRCRELRPRVGEVPSSCYVLWNALHAMCPGDSDPPIVKLSEIQQIVSEHSSTAPVSLFSLLPSHTENPPPSHVEDIHSLLVKLEERRAVLILSHLDSEDPLVVFDELKLITLIDSALIQRAMRLSAASYLNPAIMSDDKLVHCLSPLSNSLKKAVLLNILHHFMIMEVMARGNDTKYFLPSVLNIYPSADGQVQVWKMDDASYTIGFAQCIVPRPNQVIPVFMPRFLYFLLYELYSSLDDYDNVSMSQSGLHFEIAQFLQVYITIDSSAVVVNMRCSQSGIFSCLKFRNLFESIIHRQRELLQPMVKITEYIVPIEGINLPVTKVRHILAHGIKVDTLKNFLITKSTTAPSAESMVKLRSFEPYEWLSKLQKSHLNSLLDHRLTNVQVSKPFIRDLASCVGSNWKKLLEFSDDLQNCDTSPHSDENSSSDTAEPQDRPTYHVLLGVFSSMSIFQTNLASVLKNPEEYRIPSTPLVPQRDIESNQSEPPSSAPPDPPGEEGGEPLDESLSYLPPSSSSSNSHSIINTSGHDLSQPSQPDGITIKTCSTSSDASSLASTSNTNTNVPSMKIGRATLLSSQFPQEIQFVSQPQSLKCVSTGGTHHDEVHGISFTIPPQAVQDGGEMEIEYAVAAVGSIYLPRHPHPSISHTVGQN